MIINIFIILIIHFIIGPILKYLIYGIDDYLDDYLDSDIESSI